MECVDRAVQSDKIKVSRSFSETVSLTSFSHGGSDAKHQN